MSKYNLDASLPVEISYLKHAETAVFRKRLYYQVKLASSVIYLHWDIFLVKKSKLSCMWKHH